MKKVITLLIASVLFFANMAFAQNTLSLETYKMLKEYNAAREGQAKTKLKAQYNLLGKEDDMRAKVFIMFNDEFDKAEIMKLGGMLGIETSTVLIATIPVDSLKQVSNLKGIIRIELPAGIKPALDQAVPEAGVDAVQSGYGLKQPYTGKGVIVGIADWGFDYTHAMFSDDNGNCRVKRVWIPRDDMLYANPDYIKNTLQYSASDNTHGSHCLGIAAGRNETGICPGVAPEAELVTVELGGEHNITVPEAVQYMFDYADSAGKPIAVNLSLGSVYQTEPHDGSNPKDVMLKEMMAKQPKGKSVIVAAGNDGTQNLHYFTLLNNSNSYVFSYFNPTGYGDQSDYNSGYITARSGEEFMVQVGIGSQYTGYVNTSTFVYSTKKNGFIDTNIYSPVTGRYYNIYMEIYAASPLNGKPYCHFIVGNANAEEDIIVFNVSANNALVHAWTTNDMQQVGKQIADNKFTLTSPGDIEDVITVAAHISKTSFYKYNFSNGMPCGIYISREEIGTLGDRANFSSVGTTADGRNKPDISAPGSTLVSAYNSFKPVTTDNDEECIVGYSNANPASWYAALEGTSMACPMVTGVVALMFQVNPNLTTNEIKDILRATAKNDMFTGNARQNHSPYWGWGKINAHAVIKSLEGSGILDSRDDISDRLSIYPNPATDGNITLKLKNIHNAPYAVQIYDAAGKLVFITSITDICRLDLSHLPSGSYTTIAGNQLEAATQQFVIMR